MARYFALLYRLRTFRLTTLFLVVTLAAFSIHFYTRAARRFEIIGELKALNCHTVLTHSTPREQYEIDCFRCAFRGTPENEVKWCGVLFASIGYWEVKTFTVFVDPTVLVPIYASEQRFYDLIGNFNGLDEIVVCAGDNPDVLAHPEVAKFVDYVRRRKPAVRIVAQRFPYVG
jgi:hypothetical protein